MPRNVRGPFFLLPNETHSHVFWGYTDSILGFGDIGVIFEPGSGVLFSAGPSVPFSTVKVTDTWSEMPPDLVIRHFVSIQNIGALPAVFYIVIMVFD